MYKRQVTDSALQIMKDAGVHMAFTTNYGKIEPGMDKLQLPRVRIFGDADIQQFIYLSLIHISWIRCMV